jgi:serine protease Do
MAHGIYRGKIFISSLIGLWSVALVVGLTAGCGAPAPPTDPRLSAVQITDRSTPAVRLVVAKMDVRLAVAPAQLNDRAVATYFDLIVKSSSGQFRGSISNVRKEFMDLLEKDPEKYLSSQGKAPQYKRRFDFQVGNQGTGFIVTPDGRLVTNAHVVSKDSLKSAALEIFVKEDAPKQQRRVDRRVDFWTAPERRRLTRLFVAWDRRHARVDVRRLSYEVSSDVVGPTGTPTLRNLSAKLLRIDEKPGRDLAVLKIAGTDLPTLPLGDDEAVKVGERVYALGYPGAATFNPKVFDKNQAESTLTSGILSARKKTADSGTVLQTDAAITNGNSGGPLLNEKGEVVGVTTFTLLDPDSGQKLAGYNFTIASSDVRQMLRDGSINPARGANSLEYEKALADVDHGYYKNAVLRLKKVLRADPAHPTANRQLADARKALADGKDRTPAIIFGLPRGSILMGAGLSLLTFLGFILVLAVLALRHQRRRTEVPTPPDPQ